MWLEHKISSGLTSHFPRFVQGHFFMYSVTSVAKLLNTIINKLITNLISNHYSYVEAGYGNTTKGNCYEGRSNDGEDDVI